MTIQLVITPEAVEAVFGQLARIAAVESKLDQLLKTQENIAMKLEDFQAKIDQINANTTASAAAATAAAASAGNAVTAAQAIKSTLDDLRKQIASAGLDATQEAALFASLDSAAAGTEAVKSATEGIKTANEALAGFLVKTAAGEVEPEPVPVSVVPDPVVVDPAPVDTAPAADSVTV